MYEDKYNTELTCIKLNKLILDPNSTDTSEASGAALLIACIESATNLAD